MEQDCLSDLPKFILHDILSRLSQKDAARTSILSKAWAETWSTFPILSFSETPIEGKKITKFIESEEDYLWKREKFCDRVGRTLLRFYNQCVAIKQLKLCVKNFQEIAMDVNLWLKLVCESGLEVLELDQHYKCKRRDQCYILPTCVLEAKSLTKLVLKGRIGVDLTFINHVVKKFSFKELSLERVCFEDEQQMMHLISSCPLIEYITLDGCSIYSNDETHQDYLWNSRIKSFNLHGLPRLKSVDVRGIKEISVDAPCLENFCYISRDPSAPCKTDFDRCKNLRCLCLVCSKNTIITEKWFHELFQKLPILESLELSNCTMPRRINISSDRLKVLVLSPCSKLKEINITAPNLLSCLHLGFKSQIVKPSISLLGCTSQLVVNIEMDVDYDNLSNFKEFIKEFVRHNVLPSESISLYTHWSIADELDPIVLQVSPTTPPPSIKHLVLRNIPDNVALNLPFINRLLLSCCPATISLSSDFLRYNKTFIEVFYETLMGRNKDKCFCSYGHTKCWWHSLKGVKVSSSMKIGENVDFKTMLHAFQTSADMGTISFKLEF